MIKNLNEINELLLDLHDINCCSEQHDRHFKFQCRFSKEPLIATYHWVNYIHLGAEQVEQFITFMAASEIDSFMAENYETCIASKGLKFTSSFILNYGLDNFRKNEYTIDYRERLLNLQEDTHILQEPMEEEIAETERSLDEKEVESDDQKKEELSSYPYLPSNMTNS